MHPKFINKKIVLSLFILILLLASILASCEPYFTIKIENQTDQELSVYIDGNLAGAVSPSDTIEAKTMLLGYVTFTAKNNKGETIFSKKYNPDELNEYRKVVIK